MRFIADGPSIPDELLVSRDRGDVIFFCGAGVSQANAGLPNFEQLGRSVIRLLGSAKESPARRLLDKALEMGRMAGVGGLLATDRVFSLLEQEFEVTDVRSAVAQAIRPHDGYGLEAHQIMLDLATSRAGITRLVTTNFDLLFEECAPNLTFWGPPRLPDPRHDREFRGVIHLHGRVDDDYQSPRDDEFVVSSADFGRAYLTDGWAAHFIQSLLSRFQIVFVGYTADDPPVQYLLEALNLRVGSKSRLFAFQDGETRAAVALWEQKGVQAIPFDSGEGFEPLWQTLAAWAERARDLDAWYSTLLQQAVAGPAALAPHIRGQLAHLISTREGARRIASAQVTLSAIWLLTFDARHRYGPPDRVNPYDETSDLLSPFDALGLDWDVIPEPADPSDTFQHRLAFDKRSVPDSAWDAFDFNQFDVDEVGKRSNGRFRGASVGHPNPLSPRLSSVALWIQKIAHDPITLWWAAHQSELHPTVVQNIDYCLTQQSERFSDSMLRGWRMLLAAWADKRGDRNMLNYQIKSRVSTEGWTHSLMRQFVGLYRPRLIVRQASGIPHPLTWEKGNPPENLIHADVEYPSPYEPAEIPDDCLAYAISQFRGNLELAVSLEREISGHDQLYFETTRADDTEEMPDDSYGLTGPIVQFQKLMFRWAKIDLDAARAEALRWIPAASDVFIRLGIWAAGSSLLTSAQAGELFLSLSDSVFWGSRHDRDLLYALRDQWGRLQKDDRIKLEERLRFGSFPWSDDVRGGRDRAAAYYRLNKLHWLSSQGIVFSFDLATEKSKLTTVAPDWTTQSGDEAAFSRAPKVFSVSTDYSPDPLLEIPLRDILSRASETGSINFREHVQREPFQGLSARRPSRALGALTLAARQGEFPRWAWSAFLRSDGRSTDSIRRTATIAWRLASIPHDQLNEIAHPVSDWMEATATQLHGDASRALEALWNNLIGALSVVKGDSRREADRSWANDALNAPVGKLVNFLLKDPAKNGLAHGAGYPAHWTDRLRQLLNLPGNLRRHALVMTSFQVTWLFAIDPVWTERNLLPCASDPGEDGNAFWDGVLWSARIQGQDLFSRLKPGLLARAVVPRLQRNHGSVIAGLLLSGWGGDPTGAQISVSDEELREVLIQSDDDLRGQLIWQLMQWSSKGEGHWSGSVIPFFTNVWPKQSALRTPAISARLADFALSSKDLMPAVVELILPRLVPVRRASLSMLSLTQGSADYPPRKYPRATLDLLWAILAEDPELWPYQIEVVLSHLAESPETSADPRLSELRRRREV